MLRMNKYLAKAASNSPTPAGVDGDPRLIQRLGSHESSSQTGRRSVLSFCTADPGDGQTDR